jgi:menaquinone-dependent protoporphyrinogen IX oxidase
MKTLVVYYSRDGATKKVAEELRLLLGADVEEITEPKGRGGPMGWVRSGREASSGTIVPINPTKYDPSTYDVVVVGTPIWAWNVSSPVRSYMVASKGKLAKVAFFCCMDSKPSDTFKVMEGLAGRAPVACAEFKGGDVKSGAFKEQRKAFAEKVKAA